MSNANEEMLGAGQELPFGVKGSDDTIDHYNTDQSSADWRPGQALFTGSVEKNSRGFTWKVSAGNEGVPLDELMAGLQDAVGQMTAVFGGPTGKGE